MKQLESVVYGNHDQQGHGHGELEITIGSPGSSPLALARPVDRTSDFNIIRSNSAAHSSGAFSESAARSESVRSTSCDAFLHSRRGKVCE